MKNFSVAEAFSAGVAVIERHAKTVLIWGLAIFVIQLAPRLAAMALDGGALLVPGASSMPSPELAKDPSAFLRQLNFSTHSASGIIPYIVLAWLWSTLGKGVINAAVYRAVLKPKDSRYAFLRVGGTELLQALLMLCQELLFVVWAVVYVLVLLLVSAIAHIAPPPVGTWLAMLLALAVTVVFFWVILRLQLAGPMTFTEGKFRLFESWSLTRGRSWKMFWTMVLASALIVGLDILFLFFLIVPLGVMAGAINTAFGAGGMASVGGLDLSAPLALVWLLFVSGLIAALRTLLVAPWASAYRGLAGGEA